MRAAGRARLHGASKATGECKPECGDGRKGNGGGKETERQRQACESISGVKPAKAVLSLLVIYYTLFYFHHRARADRAFFGKRNLQKPRGQTQHCTHQHIHTVTLFRLSVSPHNSPPLNIVQLQWNRTPICLNVLSIGASRKRMREKKKHNNSSNRYGLARQMILFQRPGSANI